MRISNLIIYILLGLGQVTAQTYRNILRTDSLVVRHVLDTKDETVFCGMQLYKQDSLLGSYFNCMVGSVNKTTGLQQNVILYPNDTTIILYPFKLFKNDSGYTLINECYSGRGDSIYRFSGLLIIDLSPTFTIRDTFRHIVHEVPDSVRNVMGMYSEVVQPKTGQFLFPLVYKKDAYPNNWEYNALVIFEQGIFKMYEYELDDIASFITTIQPVNYTDSISYMAFSGYRDGSVFYLDSSFNIVARKEYNPGSIEWQWKPLEARYLGSPLFSITHQDAIYVIGVADSSLPGGQYAPRVHVRKWRNGIPVAFAWLTDAVNEFVEESTIDDAFTHQVRLSVSTEGRIMVLFKCDAVSRMVTYLAILDTNLSIINQRFLNRESPFSSGLMGVVPQYERPGGLLYGLTCKDCDVFSTNPFQFNGFIASFDSNGVFASAPRVVSKTQLAQVWPNPASTSLTFGTSQNIHQIVIYSIQGKLITTATANEQSSNELELNCTSWPSGIYLAYITTANQQTHIIKVVKR
ncbi:MAG: T9SS type A sorting domain-containing protein [Bacteroidia bacterium]|jgi:hypothetical protein|nr:T9SS type A sorting domain-containing protein [Bacteroidia bacterium]